MRPSSQASGMFVLADRFEVTRVLGKGGFGVVFEAYDRRREARVALKKLTHLDAGAIYRFKREFRSLVDVSHPNLVGLHELFSIDEQWYISMDLVEGMSFLAWVRGHDEMVRADTLATPDRQELAVVRTV